MAGRGPAPKPPQLRQNRNKKTGAATLTPPNATDIPELLNPDGREFHTFTIAWWERVWQSPMANEYLPTDIDGLARLAVQVDNYNKIPDTKTLAEIRLQESRFGLSPLDRSRLHWEVARGEEAERKRKPPKQPVASQEGDPRLLVVEGGGKK